MEYKFTSENFEEEVMKSDVPVLIDFYADWCGPCKMMAPSIAAMETLFEGKVKIGKLNVDDNSEIAEKYGVMSIPTLIFFKNGEPVETSVGMISRDALEAKLNAFV